MIHLKIPKSPQNNFHIHAYKYNDEDKKYILSIHFFNPQAI